MAGENPTPNPEPTPTPTPEPAPAKADRPDYVPEKFWDGEKGEVRVQEALKSYGDLEKKLTGGKGVDALTAEIADKLKAESEAARTKDRPAKVEDYKLTVPEGVMPEGMSFEFDETDPRVGWWRQNCYDNGRSQAEFEAGIKVFLEGEVGKLQRQSEALVAEFEKLGETGKAQVDFITGRITDIAGPAAVETLAPFLKTAAAVEAMGKLIEATGGPRFSDIHKAEQTAGGLTEADLKGLQASEAYRDPSHAEHAATRKKVEDGWKKLYPGEHKGGFVKPAA